jgi:hypothetical protein
LRCARWPRGLRHRWSQNRVRRVDTPGVRDVNRICHEAVSALWRRFDVRPAVRLQAQGLSEHEHVLGEVGLLDEAVGPEGLHQLLFADHAIPIPQQQMEGVDGFRRERHRDPVALQPVREKIQPKRPELVAASALGHKHSESLKKI